MLMAIAIGMPYQTLNSAMSGTGAPNAVFRPIDANVTVSGTPSASTYQIQLTGQRINRDPMALSPATPSVRGHHDQCRNQDARSGKALPGNDGPAEGTGEQEESDNRTPPEQGRTCISAA
jgi:hypothetical protein